MNAPAAVIDYSQTQTCPAFLNHRFFLLQQLVEMAQAEHTREKENQDVLMEKDTNDVGVDEKKEATVNVVTANGNCNNESVGEDEVEKDATAHGVKREASTSSADSETVSFAFFECVCVYLKWCWFRRRKRCEISRSLF